MRVGGVVVYHSFMEGCTKPRRPRFLLKHGELRKVFAGTEASSDRTFTVLVDELFTISDGRPTCLFIAMRES